MAWTRKHLLSIEELSAAEINLVLETAASFKEVSTREIKKVPALRGKTVATLFFEPSTRTRTSFELAAKRLSADVVGFSPSTSSLVKGETIIDTGENLEAMKVDCFVVRHASSGVPALLARKLKASIINAGDGNHEHPTQALLDLLTIQEHKKRFRGLKVAILGDLRHSRVARSNIWALTKLGAEVILCGPPPLIPPGLETTGARVTVRRETALKDADVIYILRIQLERQQENYFPSLREYSRYYQVNRETLSLARPDAIVMHPGPMNRGVEISTEAAEDRRSVILNQVENGIAARMAVLYLLLVGK
ncbi:MAG TPA: aspartate carbamoyltransferase catalytic subunit [bacterium]|uniref:Aspartate carbamoyltransferase n=1 Tax=candidate division TA06 bacterium ADurb.Bin417 TaxID=1852828 RepID=A0A1V5MF42_UNCT6|nr:MAG: Aspartate carbamoyltransferase [candidate division TA06 bacterium ADurb.Bin417]HNQ34865.1 aspartate carbamoyltransferase catalytic subunit [bacterium]HNS48931.1 aspartate carbamoyltransferase catalytic subunit [bacterium]